MSTEYDKEEAKRRGIRRQPSTCIDKNLQTLNLSILSSQKEWRDKVVVYSLQVAHFNQDAHDCTVTL